MAENSTMRTMAQPFVPGEALVKFKLSVSPACIDAILKESGTELITEIRAVESITFASWARSLW